MVDTHNEDTSPTTTGPTPRQLANRFSWAAFGRATFMFGGFAVTTILVRSVSPETFGQYSLLVTSVTLASILAVAGQGQNLVRRIPPLDSSGKTEEIATELVTAGRIRRRATLVVVLVFALMHIFGVPSLPWAQSLGDRLIVGSLAILWIISQSWQAHTSEVFRSFNDMRTAGLLAGGLKNIVFVVPLLVVFLDDRELDIAEVAAIALVSLTLSNLYGVYEWRRTGARIDLAAARSTFTKGRFRDGLPFAFNQLISLIFVRGGLYVIEANGTSDEVAIFGAVVQLMILLTAPMLLIGTVLSPIISDMADNSKSAPRLQRIVAGVTGMAGLISTAVAIIIFLFSEQLLTLLYGDFYAAGSAALMILAAGQLWNVWTGSCAHILGMTGSQPTVVWVNAIFAAVSVTASALLVPSLGANGAALAAAIAIVAQNTVLLWLAKKRTGISSLGSPRLAIAVLASRGKALKA